MSKTGQFNLSKFALDTESTKRLQSYVNSNFPKARLEDGKFVERKPNFDSRVKGVLLDYALKPEEIENELKYLDSENYGCFFSPLALFEQIQHFQGDHVPSFVWNRNFKEAKKDVLRSVRRSRLKTLKYSCDSDMRDALPRDDTHAGFEFILTGLKEKGEYLDNAYVTFCEELETAKKNGSFQKPIMVGKRLQLSGAYDDEGNRTPDKIKKKTRLISMIDIWQIFGELIWAKPFQKWMGKQYFYAGGKAPDILHSAIQSTRWKYAHWLSVDYSKYDQSLPDWLIREAFDIVWETFEQSEELKSLEWLWEIVVNDFINKQFIGPNGDLYPANHGVPSGSMFTQIIDTLCNLLMIKTYVNSLNWNSAEKSWDKNYIVDCIICGDDNLIFSNIKLDRSDLAGYLMRNFGVECHPLKCKRGIRSDDPEFLSRTWQVNGAYREPKELVAKMCYPERFRNYLQNKDLDPGLIVYSYILAYPKGMEEVLDVEKFLKVNELHIPKWRSTETDYLSGFLSYQTRYSQLSA